MERPFYQNLPASLKSTFIDSFIEFLGTRFTFETAIEQLVANGTLEAGSLAAFAKLEANALAAHRADAIARADGDEVNAEDMMVLSLAMSYTGEPFLPCSSRPFWNKAHHFWPARFKQFASATLLARHLQLRRTEEKRLEGGGGVQKLAL
jgi:hypothetical protein